MNVQTIETYEQEIATASKGQLLLITYDLLITSLKDAKKSLEREEMDSFKKEIDKGQKFLSYLMETLDMRFEISKELMTLYFFINKQLVLSKIGRKIKYLNDALYLIEIIKDGFVDVVNTCDTNKPIIENAQNILQTMAYGRNGHYV